MKCSITHEKCPCYCNYEGYGTFPEPGLCPVNAYKSSTIIYKADNPHYSKCAGHENTRISMTVSETCRYYGIARAKELRKEFEKNREDF